MTDPRYAIYFAPPPASRLWALGSRWLGRDAASNEALSQPEVRGIAPERLRQITEAARRYGFHATLKSPFHLANGTTAEELAKAVEKHAAFLRPFAIRLTVSVLDEFLVLRTTEPNRDIRALADSCITAFDNFRAPASAEELARRQAVGLGARQQSNLDRWGYPYVFEDFRFHMTLSARLPQDERGIVLHHLRNMFGPIEREEVAIDGLAIFCQPSADASFVMTQRIPLGASGRSAHNAEAL